MSAPSLRPATEADLEAMAAVYADAVLKGTATFEETPPDPEEMGRRLASVQALDLPWLVAEADGAVVGYAYLGPFRTRASYRYTVETSIYLAPQALRKGWGGALLDALVQSAAEAGLHQMVAVIGDSANTASIGLHASRGFEIVGVYRDVGWKFGRWLDVVLMQRSLTEAGRKPAAPGLIFA